jgi:hypothetical protein
VKKLSVLFSTDKFSMRNIGLAVQKRMARDFGGNADEMRRASVAQIAPLLNVNPQHLATNAQNILADFAMVLSLIPDFSRWTPEVRYFTGELVSAKSLKSEQQYQQLLRKHPRFRAAILKLGSSRR